MAVLKTLLTRRSRAEPRQGALIRRTDQSAPNAALVVTLPAAATGTRVIGVFVKYSAAPTQSGVLVEYTSGRGTAFDATLFTGATNAQATSFLPSAFKLANPDGLRVTVPAGGVGITASVTVLSEDT